ncbi:MAG: hypothetical protein JXA38_04690 [Methanosarcinaceae archaeon]|nr:hypothetical protein [Methanosarcinaceae archaeon]
MLKKIFYIFLTASALIIVITAHASSAATIHGAVYEWYTFEPLENAIIEVNSTPSQSVVARYGIYSLNLVPGDYLITASYYQNNTVTSYVEETISITNDGDYVMDLLLLPAYDEQLLNDTESSDIPEALDEETGILEEEDNSIVLYIIATIFVFVVLGFVVYISRNKPSGEKELLEEGAKQTVEIEEMIETKSPENISSLPSDLQEVLDIIEAKGGRITQKELRSKMKYSEAKVSIMVSDLQNRGLVEKFKKGRGNVIRLVDK